MNEEIKAKYEQVGNVLEKALEDSKTIDVMGEEENKEMAAIYETLKTLNESFKLEIDKLESSSEWDKFCVAFFGETNAGKSTIIETLRIIYDEEQRRIELNEQLDAYKKSLVEHGNDLQNVLSTVAKLNFALEENSRKRKIKNVICAVCLFVGGMAIGVILALIF